MTFPFNILLFIHIVCGFTSLSAAAGAICTKKGEFTHRTCGKIFVLGMTGIFLTAIPMSLITHDIFLFLIAIFSYYFALSGFLFAKTRSDMASIYAWALAIIMLVTGLAMLAYSIFYLSFNNYQGTVLTIFGALSCTTAMSDLKTYYYKKAVGNFRIIKHLTAMLGATIATLTAFTVVNFQTHPAFIAWLAPTVLILPVIFYWRHRVSKWKSG